MATTTRSFPTPAPPPSLEDVALVALLILAAGLLMHTLPDWLR